MNGPARTPGETVTRREKLAGVVFFPLYLFALPMVLPYLLRLWPGLGPGGVNLILGLLGLLWLALFFRRFLWEHYNRLLDQPGKSLTALLRGILLFFGLTFLLSLLMGLLMPELPENPNNEALLSLTGRDFRLTRATAVFIAPLVEEVLFRGVIFGFFKKEHTGLATAVSIFLFALAHVWPYAVSGDPYIWLYLLQYLPNSLALCRIYTLSDNIWMAYAFHALNNILAYALMG